MHIIWRSTTLPRRGIELGHGAGIMNGHHDLEDSALAAFAEGFGWMRGEDTTVLFDAVRFPGGDAGAQLRAAFERFLRAGQCPYGIEVAPGFPLHVNA